MGRDPPLVSTSWSPGRMDAAETFAESDVTVTTESTRVSGGEIILGSADGSTATRPDDNDSESTSNTRGLAIEPQTPLDSVRATVSSNTSGVEYMYLRTPDGTTLAQESPVSTGETVQLVPDDPLAEGQTYYVVVDNGGVSYTSGFYPSAGFPFTSPDIDIVNGVESGSEFGYAYNVASVEAEPVANSGSAIVSWPAPDDLAGWDIVPYQAVDDGGTVEIFAVDENDNVLAGPLEDPGDIRDLPRSTNVGIRVELSRPSTSENPRLEAVYRRFKV